VRKIAKTAFVPPVLERRQITAIGRLTRETGASTPGIRCIKGVGAMRGKVAMSLRSGLASFALSGLYCCVVAAEPSTSLPDVTVIAPRPPTPEELSGEAVPRFVQSHTKPSTVIHQITRWRTGICPLARGLDAGMNAFVTARIRAVAQAVGAPHDESSSCVPNVLILFTLEPQQVIDEVIKHDSRALGFHYAEQEKKLATITRPIQGWYVTSTRNFRGTETVDDPEPLGIADGNIATPKGANPSKVAPGDPGSRLTNLRSSLIASALIIVDATKIKGIPIGPLSDYLAILTLSQSKAPGTCAQLPSIMDLMAPDCQGRERPAQITAGDLAFLRALYSINLETPLDLEQSSLEAT
jgi:hypothetical protein